MSDIIDRLAADLGYDPRIGNVFNDAIAAINFLRTAERRSIRELASKGKELSDLAIEHVALKQRFVELECKTAKERCDREHRVFTTNLEQDIWIKAWIAIAGCATCERASVAEGWADKCLKAFKQRFQQEKTP